MAVAARDLGAAQELQQPMLAGLEGLSVGERPLKRRDLTFREVSSWARRQVSRIARVTHVDRSGELLVYRQAAKLVEEVGELHAEILGRSKVQRASKDHEFNQANLEGELADVVLATSLLAEILGVDLDAAVQAKIHVINSRVTKPSDSPGA
jgi:NTP pyrophosphatase (non-canonical NTP hydrolase)